MEMFKEKTSVKNWNRKKGEAKMEVVVESWKEQQKTIRKKWKGGK